MRRADSFLSTRRNRQKGTGNTDPRSALRRQASMKLTRQAYAWLNSRLGAAFNRFGKLDIARQRGLEWPSHARGLSENGRRLLALLWTRLRAERIDPDDQQHFHGTRSWWSIWAWSSSTDPV